MLSVLINFVVIVALCVAVNFVSGLVRLHKLKETLATIAETERCMRRLRQWLIETERKLSTPVVYQHCDFVEVEDHISQQQVTDIHHHHHHHHLILSNKGKLQLF